MKKLLYLILVLTIPIAVWAQTPNYTVNSKSELKAYEVDGRTIIVSLYDTLSGANDTLVVSFPTAHYQYTQASLCATWLASGTTSSSFVVLQGRNASHETWNTISTSTFAAEVTSACDNDPVPYAFIRLMMVSAANIGHLRTTLVLKQL